MKAQMNPRHGTRNVLLTAVLCATALPASAALRPVNEHKAVDANGTVEIINVAGTVEVSPWDQAEVAVTGGIGARVERVEVTGTGAHVTVRVVVPNGNSYHDEGEARLKIQVPRHCSLEVSLVSADLHLTGIEGDAKLQTVSGDITGDTGGSLQVSTVSGDVRLEARNAKSMRVKTISGDATLNGGSGEVNVESVSGDANLKLGTLKHSHFESVSGDLHIAGTLEAGGQLDASSVSGDVQLSFGAVPDADIDLQSMSGDISNCFGPKPIEQQYGPGSRLNFRSGQGGGKVHADTKSGDLSLCAGK
jgi:DUF4097 and DUF4098 domain-containing protein YvlB